MGGCAPACFGFALNTMLAESELALSLSCVGETVSERQHVTIWATPTPNHSTNNGRNDYNTIP